jgi:glucokinase
MPEGHRPHRGSPAETTASHAAHVRALNVDRVLRIAVDRPGAFTRAELIHATGLSAPTVGSVTSHLIREGVLKDLGRAPSRGGRRPGLVEFNSQHGFVAGIDLGPTRTRLGVADMRGEHLGTRIVVTPAHVAPAAMMEQLTGELRRLMNDSGVDLDRLLALVVGIPGPVDLSTGTVLRAPNLDGWDTVPLRAMLHTEFPCAIVIENDVNLALLGEHGVGAARGHNTCAFMFVGTGIGSAILIDGVLHHGHHYMAGEIGAIVTAPEHAGRDFGSRGCLEIFAGMAALRDRWDPDHRQPSELWFASLLDAHRRNDPVAVRAVDETATLVGMATAQLGAVVDPSVIVLGGSMFAENSPLVDAVRCVVRRIARTPFEVVLSELGKEAPLAGCLLVGAREAQRALRQRLRAVLRRKTLQ